MTKKVYVTGGLGFIGHHLVPLLNQNYEVIVVDDMTNPTVKAIKGVRVMVADCASDFFMDELEAVAKDSPFVVHLAALSSVPACEQDPAECWRINVKNSETLFQRCRHLGIATVFASSAAVYAPSETPSAERERTIPIAARSVYGRSKSLVEQMCFPDVSLRLFNVFGRGQPNRGAIVPAILHAMRTGNNFEMFGDGCQVRDYVPVDYVCRIFEAVTARLAREDMPPAVLNVASGFPRTIRRLIEIARETKPIHVCICDGRPGDIKVSLADVREVSEIMPPPDTDVYLREAFANFAV